MPYQTSQQGDFTIRDFLRDFEANSSPIRKALEAWGHFRVPRLPGIEIPVPYGRPMDPQGLFQMPSFMNSPFMMMPLFGLTGIPPHPGGELHFYPRPPLPPPPASFSGASPSSQSIPPVPPLPDETSSPSSVSSSSSPSSSGSASSSSEEESAPVSSEEASSSSEPPSESSVSSEQSCPECDSNVCPEIQNIALPQSIFTCVGCPGPPCTVFAFNTGVQANSECGFSGWRFTGGPFNFCCAGESVRWNTYRVACTDDHWPDPPGGPHEWIVQSQVWLPFAPGAIVTWRKITSDDCPQGEYEFHELQFGGICVATDVPNLFVT